MNNIKQLLEKANRKCEMRWRVFAFDPAKDNELVHTSKDAFDCIKMAGEYKMDLAKKHPDYIIEIIAESKKQRNESNFSIDSVSFDDRYKKAYEEAKKLDISVNPIFGYPVYNNRTLVQKISKKFPVKTPHISICPYTGYYAINVVANGSIWHNLDNKKFSTVKEASEYAKQRYSHPQYIDILVSDDNLKLESSQKNEADKTFLKKIEDVLHRYNLPSAKIVDERKVDNTHYIYKIDVSLTDYAKSLQKDAIDFDKVKKDNALKALSFLTIDGIYPQRNSQSILMQVNFHKGKPESAQKNEAYKVGDKVRITSKGTFGYGNTGIIRAINGDKFTIDFNTPNSGTIKLSAKDITKESAQKNEVNYSSLEKFFKQKQKEVDSTAKKLEILKAKLEKAKNLLSKAKDRAVVIFYGGFEDVPLVAYAESFNDLKDAEELFSKIKSQSAASSYATSKGSFVSPIEAIELLYYQKTKEVVFFDKDFEKLYKSGFSSESSQKNEEKEFTIKLVTPFGKAKVCSWKANSVDAAVKEFLDANPAYRENKKGAVIAESAQKNEATYDIHTLKMDPASNPYKALPFKFSAGDILKSRDGKRQMKVLRKAGTQYEVQVNNEPKKVVEVTELRNFLVESLGDDIVREVKEEVKDGVKDIVQQDVDAKLNGEVTPADYQATYGEDIDDDSDSIFGDELDNVEPDEPEQV